jgi:hypothetical protein
LRTLKKKRRSSTFFPHRSQPAGLQDRTASKILRNFLQPDNLRGPATSILSAVNS